MTYSFTQAEVAEHLGISQPRVSKLTKQGKLNGAFKKRKGRYYYDPEKVDAILPGNMDPINRKPKKEEKKGPDLTPNQKQEKVQQAGMQKLDYNKARTLNEQYKAALKKLEYEEKSGKLVQVDKVEKVAFAAGRQIKEQCLSIADRCAPLVAAESDQFECKQILLKEINYILEGLSSALQIPK